MFLLRSCRAPLAFLRTGGRALLLILLWSVALTAQDAVPKIKSIEIQGLQQVSRDAVLFYLGIKEGDPFDGSKLQAALPKLLDSHLVSDCRIQADVQEDGVRLVLQIVERPLLKEIAFKGNKALSSNQIKDKIKEKKIALTEGREYTEEGVQQVRTLIKDAYKEIGYPATEVKVSAEAAKGGHGQKVTFAVDEGTKVPIGRITFIGNTLFSQQRLRWAMKKTKQHSLISLMTKHELYSAENFREDAEKIKALYRAKGYKDVKIGEPKIESYIVDPKKNKKRIALTVSIEEGPQFFIRNIRIKGATLFPADVLMKEIKLVHGQILNFQKLQDAIKTITDRYNSRGYITAYINPVFDEVGGQSNLLDITLDVDESGQYRLGRIEFSGNSKTLDKVLRRELAVTEGEVFNADAFRKSLLRVNQLGFFKLNEEKPVDTDIDSQNKLINFTIYGQEAAKSDVQFAAGYSQLDGLFGQFMFNTRNFLGRGETLSLSYQNGKRNTYYDLTYSNPWFLDTSNALSASIYDRELDYPTFNRKSKGIGLGYGFRLGTFSLLNFYYNDEDITAIMNRSLRYGDQGSHPRPVEDPSIGGNYANVTATSSSFTPSFTYNTKDDPMDPFKGVSYRISARYSGGPFGGSVDLFEPITGFTLYQPIMKDWTTAANMEVGQIFKTSNTEVPSYERFFMGGETSVRGFSYRSIYPIDPVTGIYGGTKYIQLNFESIWRLQQAFRFVVFFDAGNTWLDSQNFNLFGLRSAAGVEFRIFLPVFMAPLRFIYGVNLVPKPGEDHSNFQFTIGTSF